MCMFMEGLFTIPTGFLVCQIRDSKTITPTSWRGGGGYSSGSGAGRGSQSGPDTTARVFSSAISTLGILRGRGCGDVSYIITGSGSPEDSSIAVMDVRNSSTV